MRYLEIKSTVILSVLALCAGAREARAQQFQQVTTFPGTPRWTEGVECADVDQDGDLDVFFAEGNGYSSTVTKHQNTLVINKLVETGPWIFADESVLRLGTHASMARGVTTGDVNGDGWVDALFANAFNGDPPFLYINQGAANPGFFNMESATRGFTTNYSSASACFGDVDDDGDLDVIINDAYFANGKPHLFINDGTGVFTENAAALNAPTKNSQMDVQFVDIDNNWTLDFFGDCRATNAGGNHYLMLNNGAGVFTDSSSTLAAGNGSTYEAEVGDLDGDNDIDLFFVSLSNLSEGAVRNNIVPNGTLSFTNQSLLNATADDNEIALFDYDNDGDYDVVVGSLDSHEGLYRNDGGFVFSNQSAQIQAVSDSTLDCTVGDLNNDGKYDIITAQGESGAFGNKFYRNTGSADTLPPVLVAQINPVTALATGPVVAHAKIRDQVLDDGVNYVTSSVNYVINTAPSAASISINGGGFSPSSLGVAAGTTIIWTNNSGATQSVKSTTSPYTYDSGSIAAGGTYAFTYITPGTYNYTSVPGGFSAQVTVTGSATAGKATYSGGQIYRFEMQDTAGGQGVQLCYELRFRDWPGNVMITDSRCIPLTGRPVGTPFCFGDNSDPFQVACPCSNPGAAGHGCANSVDANGGLLGATGSTAIDPMTGTDAVVLHASSMPSIATTAAIFLQGDVVVAGGVVFGDGVRCAGGNLVRLGSKATPGGIAQYPEAGNQSVSQRGGVTPGSGVTRYYQTYYRNSAASFCPPATFNVTNGVTIVW